MKNNITIDGVEISREKLKEIIQKHPELIEKKNKRWRADWGERYWFVMISGDTSSASDLEHDRDNFRYNTLNYFSTREEAQAHKERLLAIGKVTMAIEELNGDWEVDWSDSDSLKYYIFYSCENGLFEFNYISYMRDSLRIPYIKSREIAKQIIKDYEPELKIIWGIK